MKKEIEKLLNSSKKVILDCSLKNGAIVAANSSKDYFPKEAKYYKYVWPRDASYTCIAANILGIRNIQEKFFKWCERAEGWNESGLFYKNYYIDGRKKENSFQPDQTGSILIALYDFYKNDKDSAKKFKNLIIKSADALCAAWKKDHFILVGEDIWEERHVFPDFKENFTYSLAVCSAGLEFANDLVQNKKWEKVAKEMKNALLTHFKNNYYRSFGKINDERVDASLLSLVWPTNMVSANSKTMKQTIKLMEIRIIKDHSVFRYEQDDYDGWMYKIEEKSNKLAGANFYERRVADGKMHRNKGAGYWPLLNFWMCIYYVESGNKAKALKYYNKVLNDLKNKIFIPEQIFDNSVQVSVSPLCWSHSMFVIASKKLGYL